MNKIVLHIPHSSEKLPPDFFERVTIDEQEVREFCHIIADNKTQELFGNNDYEKIVFDWSRIYCDVEKFIDPQKEIMSKFGMGVVYTKTNEGKTFLNPTKQYTQKIIKEHYLPHHQQLDMAVKRLLKTNKVILVDCHSFCRDIIMFKDKRQDLPDICIGFNEPSPTKVAEVAIKHFKDLGYKVKENYPYCGSMVPDALIEHPNNNFYSIMIEINKEMYLDNPAKFEELQKQANSLFHKLELLEID